MTGRAFRFCLTLPKGTGSFIPNCEPDFEDSQGSAKECAACLDGLVAKRACEPVSVRPGKEMLVRIVQMLARLIERNRSQPDSVREEVELYRVRTDFGDNESIA